MLNNETKITNRTTIYDLIELERLYQNSLPHHSLELDMSHSVADWLIFIEKRLDDAKLSIYNLDKGSALSQMRVIAALAVACMEFNGAPKREIK